VLQILCSVNTLQLAFMAQYRALHFRSHSLRRGWRINFEQCHVPIVRAIVPGREASFGAAVRLAVNSDQTQHL
jgi:hypothetical protein